VFLDFLAGLIKKLSQPQDKKFVLELEGLADFFAFGASPALFILLLSPNLMFFFGAFIFCAASLVRIARFNCEGLIGGYYRGLPTTYNGYIIPAAYFITETFLPGGAGAVIYPLLLLSLSALMVSANIWIREIG
jgi:phosphatidylserine synthase